MNVAPPGAPACLCRRARAVRHRRFAHVGLGSARRGGRGGLEGRLCLGVTLGTRFPVSALDPQEKTETYHVFGSPKAAERMFSIGAGQPGSGDVLSFSCVFAVPPSSCRNGGARGPRCQRGGLQWATSPNS